MARTPKPTAPNKGYAGVGRILGDPPASGTYPIERGGKATPDRSRAPDIGAACVGTRKPMPRPATTDELREGVELGTTRGNNEVQKTAQEFGDARREARGVRTRPARPGSANY